VPSGAAVLVVDAESRDGSVSVARAAGASVVVRPWEGFVATRRFALSLVQTPWTFMLDADEALDAPMRAAIAAATPSANVSGYRVSRVNYFCGRAISGAGWGGERLLRLFRAERARLEARPAAGGDAEVHERWVADGEILDLGGALHHDSYPTIASYREKFARYTSLESRGLRGTPLAAARASILAIVRFPWLFLARGGWRDGWRGAFIAFFSALYPAVVALKALRR
jgi:glycosyltransferase involved in cell wall biosynthesis